jgi:hypothetical protein
MPSSANLVTDPVINQLDPHDQYFTRRLYREVRANIDASLYVY